MRVYMKASACAHVSERKTLSDKEEQRACMNVVYVIPSYVGICVCCDTSVCEYVRAIRRHEDTET